MNSTAVGKLYLGITMEPERDFYVEAQMILKGLTGIQPELRHLEALEEHYQCSLIRVANKLGELKATVLEMP